jgi:hypothetical protein
MTEGTGGRTGSLPARWGKDAAAFARRHLEVIVGSGLILVLFLTFEFL